MIIFFNTIFTSSLPWVPWFPVLAFIIHDDCYREFLSLLTKTYNKTNEYFLC